MIQWHGTGEGEGFPQTFRKTQQVIGSVARRLHLENGLRFGGSVTMTSRLLISENACVKMTTHLLESDRTIFLGRLIAMGEVTTDRLTKDLGTTDTTSEGTLTDYMTDPTLTVLKDQ